MKDDGHNQDSCDHLVANMLVATSWSRLALVVTSWSELALVATMMQTFGFALSCVRKGIKNLKTSLLNINETHTIYKQRNNQ